MARHCLPATALLIALAIAPLHEPAVAQTVSQDTAILRATVLPSATIYQPTLAPSALLPPAHGIQVATTLTTNNPTTLVCLAVTSPDALSITSSQLPHLHPTHNTQASAPYTTRAHLRYRYRVTPNRVPPRPDHHATLPQPHDKTADPETSPGTLKLTWLVLPAN